MSDRVPFDKTREGALKALNNAKSWLNDAKVLIKNSGQPGHIVALGLNALEELAKAFFLTQAVIERQRHIQVPMRDLANSSHDKKLVFGIWLCLNAQLIEYIIESNPDQIKMFADILQIKFDEQGYFDALVKLQGNFEDAAKQAGLFEIMMNKIQEMVNTAQPIPGVNNIEDFMSFMLRTRERGMYVDWYDVINGFTGPEDINISFAEEILSLVSSAMSIFGDKMIAQIVNASDESIKRMRQSSRQTWKFLMSDRK